MVSAGVDAHRAAGAVDEPQAGGQQLVEAPAHDGVGLAAADLHQGPGAGGDGRQLGRQSPDLGSLIPSCRHRRADHGPGAAAASAA